MWPINLSVRLLIVALVGRYLTNQLIRRGLLLHRIAPLIFLRCLKKMLCGISTSFPVLSPCGGQIAHALLTHPPLISEESARGPHLPVIARLACVRHAASVRPEPGSNSQIKYLQA